MRYECSVLDGYAKGRFFYWQCVGWVREGIGGGNQTENTLVTMEEVIKI